MKFETPIAEIELFELKDIISASGESVEPSDTTDDTSDVGMVFAGNCIYHDARDNDDWDRCLL